MILEDIKRIATDIIMAMKPGEQFTTSDMKLTVRDLSDLSLYDQKMNCSDNKKGNDAVQWQINKLKRQGHLVNVKRGVWQRV